jgi:phosphate transport system substrate-binding protein
MIEGEMPKATNGGTQMKKSITALAILVAALCGDRGLAAGPLMINGAGASFPYPLYAQWAYKYEQTAGVRLNYQSIGSGGGITQIKAKTVDFGASDAPLKAEELQQAGLLQFPMVIGGVVPVLNVPGISAGKLRLTPGLLADIYLGKVTRWDDPTIKAANQGLALPAREITVVHRADGSGTTWIFTNYLDKVSADWHAKVGTDKSVAWPVGIGGKGNEGVAAFVQQVEGAIGYVEYAYAVQNKLVAAQLRNRAGTFVSPAIGSFQAAAAGADWKATPGFALVLTDQPGEGSWPITGASFILIRKAQADAARARAMLAFFDWCYRNGGAQAEKLDYVPIPSGVIDLVEASWKTVASDAGKPVWP